MSRTNSHARANRQARVYTTPEGNRLNSPAIRKRFKVPRATWKKRADAAGLTSEPMPFSYPIRSKKWRGPRIARREEATWLETEVRAALAPKKFPLTVEEGVWLNPHTFQPKNSEDHFYTERGIRDHSSLAARAGRTARRPSRSRLLGKAIGTLKVTSPYHSKRRILVYASKDVNLMDRAAATAPKDYRAQTPGYLTRRQLKEKFGVSDNFPTYWNKHPSRMRNDGEPALRSTKEPYVVGGRGGTGEIIVYCEEDASNIFAGKETHPLYLGTGRPKNATMSKKTRDQKAVDFLRELLTRNGPMLVSEIRSLAAAKGINPAIPRNRQTALDRAKKKLRVKSRRKFGPPGGSPVYWYLPNQTPPKVIFPRPASEAKGQARGSANGQTSERETQRQHAAPEPGRKRRGPLASGHTQEIYAACYDGIAAGKSLKRLARELAERFSAPDYSPPKTPQDVSCYARRHARKNGKPWPISRQTE